MKNTVSYYARGLDFPADAISYLLEQTSRLEASANAMAAIRAAEEKVFASTDAAYEEILETAAAYSGVPRFTVDMIFFLFCAPTMQKRFAAKGVDDAIFWASLCDLRYKLIECKNLHGYYGSFTKNWFPRFLRADAFALGRLQYELKPFSGEEYGTYLQKGDTVCNCHIPSSGRLLFPDVLDSLRRAYDFYKSERKDGVLPVTCNSWMLYPPLIERLPESSNIRRFYELFDVITAKEQEHNRDFWRIFSLPFTPENLQIAPENSSLQRTVKAFLKEGNLLGSGLGVLLFDGEKVLSDRHPS